MESGDDPASCSDKRDKRCDISPASLSSVSSWKRATATNNYCSVPGHRDAGMEGSLDAVP